MDETTPGQPRPDESDAERESPGLRRDPQQNQDETENESPIVERGEGRGDRGDEDPGDPDTESEFEGAAPTG